MRLLIFSILLATLSGGCKGGAEPPKITAPKITAHGEQKSPIEADKKGARIVGVVKKAVFDVNRSKSVGKAIDDYRYFTSREWKETYSKNGTIYVDFFGALDPKELDSGPQKYGVVARTVNVKFVVKEDGTCFVGMVTLYDTSTDGNVYPAPVTDVAGVMNAIYANEKLPHFKVDSDSPWRHTVIK